MSQYRIVIYFSWKSDIMIDNNEPLRIKRKGEDGYKLISVRIREDTLEALDKMAAETHYSRNELINMILEHGAKNAIIE